MIRITRRAGASMRPGRICPGKHGASRTRGCHPRRFNEARANLPGKAYPCGSPALRSKSFKRPGRICPGKHPTAVPCRDGDGASMRPGRICPGKWLCPVDVSSRGHSFNEARANLPGKADDDARVCAGDTGFNEARANLPGKETSPKVFDRQQVAVPFATAEVGDGPWNVSCHSLPGLSSSELLVRLRLTRLRPLAGILDPPERSQPARRIAASVR